MTVSVDEVTNMVGVGMGHGGSMGIGNSGDMSVGQSGSNGSGSGIDNGSDLTDRINETVLVIIFRVSLKSDILEEVLYNEIIT